MQPMMHGGDGEDDTGRNDLLASIRAGSKLKTVETGNGRGASVGAAGGTSAPTDARTSLMSDIINKGTKTLRTVSAMFCSL